MTVKDELLKLRTPLTAVTTTEAGWTTLARHTTGQIVVQIDKCPMGGIPIEVVAAADSGNGTTGTHIVTIEASDELASEWIVVATFPTLIQTAAANKLAFRFVRRVATQLKYLRSVITRVAGDGTMSRNYTISVGVGLIDDDAGFTGSGT